LLEETAMNIGTVAERSGVSAKMIRHYESISLLPPAARTDSGYRQYSERDVHVLHFIRQARNLGFSIAHIRDLVDLWRNPRRSSARVKHLAQAHLDEVDARIKELKSIRKTLQNLVVHCHGDERPDCPILDTLAAPTRLPG
jgi:MerR family copper efflux transcriptional regulator